ncbi:MAG: DNA-3-methyladenine glycosylase I [Acidimicrobiia bacterium]|nr:DNA-3-methyladenine glycosylase I [bacterium]MXW69143.1 DNA-3-methyladenine glycosylase I [Acidimicrobiia bacterium]MDE0675694.1 DNA-3-methyladenine glycosylase I [bacterium]MXX01235.1 DNA-3-methyladenine glycosylase I [Acidimicrobiia bacterium]MXX45291.1 DNA-3-methyladenine glycosylase I [Acidimicrobiia bacterium]
MDPGLVTVGPDGARRCWWGSEPAEYRRYHDQEWGFGVTGEERLFEKICLEGFQAGLSWLTVLRKRQNFREAFSGFDPALVVEYGERDIERLMVNAGIIRHRGKIRSVINNAARAQEMRASHGSLSVFFWEWAEFESAPLRAPPPALTRASTALAKELRRRGWTFIGPTTCYAFMQAMGLVNDHMDSCWVREEAEASRRRAAAKVLNR